jgi:hypothetical protein
MLGYDPRIASKAPGRPITPAGPQDAILALDTALETLAPDVSRGRLGPFCLPRFDRVMPLRSLGVLVDADGQCFRSVRVSAYGIAATEQAVDIVGSLGDQSQFLLKHFVAEEFVGKFVVQLDHLPTVIGVA